MVKYKLVIEIIAIFDFFGQHGSILAFQTVFSVNIYTLFDGSLWRGLRGGGTNIATVQVVQFFLKKKIAWKIQKNYNEPLFPFFHIFVFKAVGFAAIGISSVVSSGSLAYQMYVSGIYLFVYLSICLSNYLSMYLFIYVSICLFT